MLKSFEEMQEEVRLTIKNWASDGISKNYYRNNYHLITIFDTTHVAATAICTSLFNPTRCSVIGRDIDDVIHGVMRDKRVNVMGFLKKPTLPLMPICWIETNPTNNRLKLTIFTVNVDVADSFKEYVKYDIGLNSQLTL